MSCEDYLLTPGIFFIEQDIGKSQVSPIPLVGSAGISHPLFYFIKGR